MENSTNKNTSSGPNKFNFKILQKIEYDMLILLCVKYPNYQDFNGIKILVYDICYKDFIETTNELDPNFLEDKPYPVAIFKGNGTGFNLAQIFCRTIDQLSSSTK